MSSGLMFFVGLGIAFLPLVITLIEAYFSSLTTGQSLIDKLKELTIIFQYFATPMSFFVAILAGSIAYRKYFDEKEKEQKLKEIELETKVKIVSSERANMLYELLNTYTAAYDSFQVAKSTDTISSGSIQNIRSSVASVIKNIQSIDPNQELKEIYTKRFDIDNELK